MAILLFTNVVYADESLTETESALKVSGYLETYYLHAFNHHSGHLRPSFIYSHNISGKPSVNLAMVKATYSKDTLRANLALGSGSYMRANYALEPDDLQKVYEANFGVKLSENSDLWLDVGILPSHIGFESAVGIDNWTVTRSLAADNSPYFETGARVSYTSENGEWTISGLLLNGWQRIQRPNQNSTPSLGHQITYRPNGFVTLNSSSYVGNDKSDHERKMRYFHHFYGQFKLSDQFELMTGLDVGAEQKARNSSQYNVWFTPVLIGRYRYSDKLSFAARAEYYQDEHGVIIDTGTPNGFKTFSYSTNVDYKISQTITLRAELKQYHSKDKIFPHGENRLSQDDLIATTVLAISY